VIDPGDEVLIPDPGWPNYESICHLAGAKAVRYALPAARGFLPDPDAIRRQINARTKALLLNSPGNPSGAVFAPELVREFARLAAETGVYLISDEIYEDMIFEGRHESIGAHDVDDRALVISGFSKSYAMTGWRLGWIVCPAHIAPLAAGLQEPVVSCAPTMIQKAGEAALAGDQSCVRELCDTYRRRRDVVIEVFGQTEYLPVAPNGAFYALIDVARSGMRSLDFAKALLAREDVAVVPGVTFGPQCDRYVRVAFTVPDPTLRDGLTRLRRFLDAQAQR
jgi:aspartate/methionine/tyrosine aminotransferase